MSAVVNADSWQINGGWCGRCTYYRNEHCDLWGVSKRRFNQVPKRCTVYYEQVKHGAQYNAVRVYNTTTGNSDVKLKLIK